MTLFSKGIDQKDWIENENQNTHHQIHCGNEGESMVEKNSSNL